MAMTSKKAPCAGEAVGAGGGLADGTDADASTADVVGREGGVRGWLGHRRGDWPTLHPRGIAKLDGEAILVCELLQLYV
jgi:hypothetical protein